MKRHIVVLSAVLCLFWVLTSLAHAGSPHAGPPTVNVMVKNGDKMDQYFHSVRDLNFEIQGGTGGGRQCIAVVPEGKRLVIEHVSFYARTPKGQKITMANIHDEEEINYKQYLISVFQGSLANHELYTASQAIRQRVVSGKNVCLEVYRYPDDGVAEIFWGLSGYFIDYP